MHVRPGWRLTGAAAFAALAVLVGCPGDGGETASASTMGTTAGSDPSTTSGTTAGTTAGTTGLPPGPCELPCVTPEDCCPPRSICPGDAYPQAWSCVDGQCVNAGCSQDGDCLFPGHECHAVDGVGFCFAPCLDDQDCTATLNMPGTTCSGMAADGTMYCVEA